MDNTRRSTYTDKTGFTGNLDREFMKMKNKVPVLSKSSQPYIDTWDREQQNLSGDPNMGERLAYQMLSPGYMSDINVTPVDREVQRLYDATSDKSVFPSDSTKKIGDVRMTKEEYTTYSKAAGQARYDLLRNVMNNDTYKALDEETQAGVVKDLYGLARKIGSTETRADYETTDKLYEAYSKGGIQGAVEYELQKNAITRENLTVTEKTSKIYKESGEQGLQQYAQAQEYAKANFKDEKGAEKDGNGSLKSKDELVPYLNARYQSKEVKRFWHSVLLPNTKNPY